MGEHICLGCKKSYPSTRALSGHQGSCKLYRKKYTRLTLNRVPKVPQVEANPVVDDDGATRNIETVLLSMQVDEATVLDDRVHDSRNIEQVRILTH